MTSLTASCFIPFTESIEGFEIPKQFTFPFNYSPHPLSVLASKELQYYLNTQTDWNHNFGINAKENERFYGKMFGVLVVQNQNNELGYLAAFSGILAKQTILKHFVPPVFDRKSDTSFYTQLEEEINEINQQVKSLKSSSDYEQTISNHNHLISESEELLSRKKKELKTAKKQRQSQRKEQRQKLSSQEFDELQLQHQKQSMDFDFGYKRTAREWKLILQESAQQVKKFEWQLDHLNSERKIKSGLMQQELFEQYQMLNATGESKNVLAIFKDELAKNPPAGAGDCAAPKLLQYAFKNKLKPIAMAEFWWGQSPKLEVRKHGHYYPACKTKCEPILGHMLQGLNVEESPITTSQNKILEIEIIFEDDFLLVINKPADLLSIPGKRIKDSVQTRMKLKFPDATGPMLAHRLDMSTSGLMVISKSLETHRNLQSQFVNRTIKKRYLAVLDGLVKENHGTITLPLRVDIDNRPSQIVCFDHGKKAITNWEVINRKNNQIRIHFFPVTGRTHQLRVHASHPLGLNAAILGDDIYGQRGTRLHLQANRLQFEHPVTKEKMAFELPSEF
jgi:tRNA pseudouridine32 synthase/23S rRNA pseudouridine746 synthase